MGTSARTRSSWPSSPAPGSKRRKPWPPRFCPRFTSNRQSTRSSRHWKRVRAVFRWRRRCSMARQRVKFTFVEELIKEPIIWKLAKEFDVVTNIRRADVTDERGWVILELDGDKDEIERSLEWVRENGVRVDPVYEDIVEG